MGYGFPPLSTNLKKKIFYCYFVSSLRFFDREKDELNLRMVCLYGKKKVFMVRREERNKLCPLWIYPPHHRRRK
jgi:hypothetical protein